MNIQRVKVMGAEFFDGDIKGEKFDIGSVYIEELLDYRHGRKKGTATVKYRMESAEPIKRIIHNEFPFFADVEFLRINKGDKSENIVLSVLPIEAVKPAKSGA